MTKMKNIKVGYPTQEVEVNGRKALKIEWEWEMYYLENGTLTDFNGVELYNIREEQLGYALKFVGEVMRNYGEVKGDFTQNEDGSIFASYEQLMNL